MLEVFFYKIPTHVTLTFVRYDFGILTFQEVRNRLKIFRFWY
jgi:hypothetical protein